MKGEAKVNESVYLKMKGHNRTPCAIIAMMMYSYNQSVAGISACLALSSIILLSNLHRHIR